MEKYPALVENMHCVTGVIDGLFETDIQILLKGQFFFYAIGFLLPFIIQRFFVTSHGWVIAFIVSSLIVQVYLFLIEISQMNYKGLRAYFSKVFNIADFLNFFCFVAYAVLRLIKTDYLIPNS